MLYPIPAIRHTRIRQESWGRNERRRKDNAETPGTLRFAEKRNPRAQSGVTVPQCAEFEEKRDGYTDVTEKNG
jgi:hypothetical protein